MSVYALIHGASSAGFYWDRVASRLTAAGHLVVAPDLPAADPRADFNAYADAVDAALDGVAAETSGPADLVVVGQSMGAITASVVASRHPGARLVLVAPMILAPGETPGEYFGRVGLEAAQQAAAEAGGYDPTFDVRRTFLHDVPPDVVDELMAKGEPDQAQTIFGQPFPLTRWPDVPIRVIACTQDRMFPLELVERVAHEQLGVRAERLDSGHLPGFGHPRELAERLTLPPAGP